MRTSLLILLLALFTACGGSSDPAAERYEFIIDSLQQEQKRSDEVTDSYIADLNGIQERLVEIKEKQGIISATAANPELSDNQRQQIEADLAELQQYMEENKLRINQLNRKIKSDGRDMKALRELVANMQEQLNQKDAEISRLVTQLAALNIRIEQVTRSYDSLDVVSKDRQETIDRQTEELNRVFYAIGTFKELQENNVVDAGGLFKTKSGARLKEAFNQDYFTRTDLRNFKELRLNSKKARVATTHPSSSYELVQAANKTYEKLVIKDAKAFWGTSRYLVIILD